MPFCTFDGTAHRAEAPSTSLRRSASVHSRMTLIAFGSPAPVAFSGTSAGRSSEPPGTVGSGCALLLGRRRRRAIGVVLGAVPAARAERRAQASRTVRGLGRAHIQDRRCRRAARNACAPTGAFADRDNHAWAGSPSCYGRAGGSGRPGHHQRAARARRHQRAGERAEQHPVQLLARHVAVLDPVEDRRVEERQPAEHRRARRRALAVGPEAGRGSARAVSIRTWPIVSRTSRAPALSSIFA